MQWMAKYRKIPGKSRGSLMVGIINYVLVAPAGRGISLWFLFVLITSLRHNSSTVKDNGNGEELLNLISDL